MNNALSGIKRKSNFILSGAMMLLSLLFTLAVKKADVRPIGPLGSEVGFASINKAVFSLFKPNVFWDKFSDLLAVFAIITALLFAFIGIVQFIKRKSILKVNSGILCLGGTYVLLVILYVVFEIVKINYRPVLDDGALAASFPSSHTMFVCTVMGTGAIQLKNIIKTEKVYRITSAVALAVIVLMIIARTLSGAHWFTDIVAGVLYGATLTVLYYTAFCELKKETDR